MTKYETTRKYWWNVSLRRWIAIQITIFERWSTFYNNSFSILFHCVFRSSSYGEFFTLYSFLLDHLDCTLVIHRNLHSSACPIRHFLWLSIHGDSWDCTVQGSSPHKCGQKSCCSTFSAVVAAFLLDISTFLSSSYVPEVHPYRWTFLEGHLSRLRTCLIDINPIWEG